MELIMEIKETKTKQYNKVGGARQLGTIYKFKCPYCNKKHDYETALCWDKITKVCLKCTKYFTLVNTDPLSVTVSNPIAKGV
jgi:hypothetical protein